MCFSRLLVRERGDSKTPEMFYVVVGKYFLIFGVEMWVVTPRILQVFEILNNQLVRLISGRVPWCNINYIWM